MKKNAEDKLNRAKNRVKQLKGFFYHATAFVFIIPALAFINYWTNEWRYMWFLWPVLGWSIGIMAHALCVFDLVPFLSKDWEKRKIQELLEKDNVESEKWS